MVIFILRELFADKLIHFFKLPLHINYLKLCIKPFWLSKKKQEEMYELLKESETNAWKVL